MPAMKISKLTKQDTISDEAIIPIASKGGKSRGITFGTLKEAIQEQVKTGARGGQGLQGVAGADGEQGIQGIQGEQGIQGIEGAKGIDGVQGNDGAQGIDGVSGSDTGAQIVAKINAYLGHTDWQLAGAAPVEGTPAVYGTIITLNSVQVL